MEILSHTILFCAAFISFFISPTFAMDLNFAIQRLISNFNFRKIRLVSLIHAMYYIVNKQAATKHFQLNRTKNNYSNGHFQLRKKYLSNAVIIVVH